MQFKTASSNIRNTQKGSTNNRLKKRKYILFAGINQIFKSENKPSVL